MKYRIPVAEPEMGEDELQKVMEAIKSGWVSSKVSITTLIFCMFYIDKDEIKALYSRHARKNSNTEKFKLLFSRRQS